MDNIFKDKIKETISEASIVEQKIKLTKDEYSDVFENFKIAGNFPKSFLFGNTLSNGESSSRSLKTIFSNLIDSYIKPDGKLSSVESKLAYLVPVLYILSELEEDSIKDTLAQFGIDKISFNSDYFTERFSDVNLWNKEDMKHAMNRGVELEHEIRGGKNSFKEELFAKIPEEARFDPTASPEGIKYSDFMKLVSMQNKKDPQAAKDKISESIEIDITNKESLEEIVNEI